MQRRSTPFIRAGLAVLAWSVPAALVYTLILIGPILIPGGARYFAMLLERTWVQIVVAYCAMILFLLATARVAAPACLRSRILTALYFVGVYFVGVIAGCVACIWVLAPEPAPPLADMLELMLTPMWLLALLGLLPAYFIGAAGHSILTKLVASETSRAA